MEGSVNNPKLKVNKTLKYSVINLIQHQEEKIIHQFDIKHDEKNILVNVKLLKYKTSCFIIISYNNLLPSMKHLITAMPNKFNKMDPLAFNLFNSLTTINLTNTKTLLNDNLSNENHKIAQSSSSDMSQNMAKRLSLKTNLIIYLILNLPNDLLLIAYIEKHLIAKIQELYF